MQRALGTKTAIIGGVALLVLAITAGVAFAAPVLQPGVTSAPGMSGTCTDCHTYATPAAPAAPAGPKPTMCSHPYMKPGKHSVDTTFTVWGYVAPKLPDTHEATVTMRVQKFTRRGWVTAPGLMATGTVSATGKFKNKTNYKAKMHFTKAARYRIRARLVWTDAKGTEHTKASTFLVLRIFK